MWSVVWCLQSLVDSCDFGYRIIGLSVLAIFALIRDVDSRCLGVCSWILV
jgi:hypothetical protein